jgi:hypothetical protein
MHYFALAIVPAEGDLDELLAETLAPFDENREDIRAFDGPVSWDWYQIGGRYTGRLGTYVPKKDPRNWEECFLCHGTGNRNDALGQRTSAANPDYGCNGCDQYREITGKPGTAVKWPTNWIKDPATTGDVVDGLAFAAQLADLEDTKLPYTIFTHGSESVTVKERWTGETFEPTGADFRATLATILAGRLKAGIRNRVVVVDYHC